jgi:hypothetical protein
VRTSGEEGPHDGGIDDATADDCNVAGTCAADIDSEILRLLPLRNYNLSQLFLNAQLPYYGHKIELLFFVVFSQNPS